MRIHNSFYYRADRDDIRKFNRLAMTLMRLNVIEYMQMDVWEERCEEQHVLSPVDYVIEHVECCVVKGGDECEDYDIR